MIKKKVLLIMYLAISGLTANCPNGNGNNNKPPTPSPSATPTPTQTPSPSPTPTPPLSITTPADGEKVDEFPFVEGTVSDWKAEVWVIVHPMKTSDYWVQRNVTVKEDGKWRVQVNIGKGSVGVGESFEIMAVANPKNSLKEGNKLPRWAEAQWKSQVIRVIRK